MTYKIRLFSGAALVLALGLAGCGDDKDGSGSGDTEADTSTGGADDDGASMTSAPTMTAADDDGGSGTAGMTSTPMTDDGMMSATIGMDDGMDPVPDGGMCTEDAMCESGQCFDGGLLGGICGECNEDADCPDGGCSVPNPLAGTPSTCNMGEMGGGCETTDVCMRPLVCALILDVPGVITASTCSDCEDDAGCTDGQLCTPTYNVSDISGFKSCEDPGSVANGLGCDLEGSGDMQCMSGICAGADVMGFLELGVCSECENDENGDPVGCDAGQTCMEAAVSLDEGLIAGTCVDP